MEGDGGGSNTLARRWSAPLRARLLSGHSCAVPRGRRDQGAWQQTNNTKPKPKLNMIAKAAKKSAKKAVKKAPAKKGAKKKKAARKPARRTVKKARAAKKSAKKAVKKAAGKKKK